VPFALYLPVVASSDPTGFPCFFSRNCFFFFLGLPSTRCRLLYTDFSATTPILREAPPPPFGICRFLGFWASLFFFFFCPPVALWPVCGLAGLRFVFFLLYPLSWTFPPIAPAAHSPCVPFANRWVNDPPRLAVPLLNPWTSCFFLSPCHAPRKSQLLDKKPFVLWFASTLRERPYRPAGFRGAPVLSCKVPFYWLLHLSMARFLVYAHPFLSPRSGNLIGFVFCEP